MPGRSEAAPALLLSGVVCGYGPEPVLRGLDLTVPAGSICALLGVNGAGKSTAARAACGLIPLRQGTATVGGRAPAAARIGLAPQESALFPALTPRENVAVMARLCGVPRADRAGAVEAALRLTDCLPMADRPVRALSGGWRRRANLAGALVGRPTLIVADEPTEGVDAGTRDALARALRAAADAGAGCLLISHDAEFVAAVADMAAVLVAGRVAAEGPPETLLRESFGGRRLLTVAFPAPASEATRTRLARAGLSGGDDGRVWSVLAEGALARARSLSDLIDGEGGEVSIRRPGVDDLVLTLTREAA